MQDVFATLPTGTIVRERYIIEDMLGKGGFGSVYLVRDRRVTGNLFALKELIDPSQQERDRFTLECELLRRLDHYALPRFYRAFHNDNSIRSYMLMDYIQGPNLETVRRQQPDHQFSLPQVLRLMKPVVEAVMYLHNQQPPIIHRDIKPANIIISQSDDTAILVDFGIAKEETADSTTTAVRRCSPGYGAPEQYTRGTNNRTDMYGLAATIYVLLTGTVPTDAFYRMTQMSSKQDDPLIPAIELVPTIPQPVSDALQRALSIASIDRFATVGEFWQALNVVPTGEETLGPESLNSGFLSAPSTFSPMPASDNIPASSGPATPVISHTVVGDDSPTIISAEQKVQLPLSVVSLSNVANASAPTVAHTHTPPPQPPGRERPPARRRRIGMAGILSLILLLVLIGAGAGAGIWFYNSQPKTTAAVTTHVAVTPHTKKAQPTPTVTYFQNAQDITGKYQGSIHSSNTNQDASMTLLVATENKGGISGTLAINAPLAENSSFNGGFTTQTHFRFTIPASNGHPSLLYQGTWQSDQTLRGTYCMLDTTTQQCSASGDSGYWTIGPRQII